jgi:UDP-glucose 4-epimerase
MRYLITGGLGFIGHRVSNYLSQFHNVIIIDSLTDYGIIPKLELDQLICERLEYVNKCTFLKNDIRQLAHPIFEVDTVIHLAAFPRAKVVNNNPVEGADVLTAGLLNLLTLSAREKIKRFVYVSSSMVYGDFENGTTEDAVCNPQGIYGILKYTGELLVRDFCTRHGIEFVILRPSAVYGPRDVEDRVISKFLVAAMNNRELTVHGASEILDFSFVDDVSLAVCQAATSSRSAGNTYNITLGHGYTLLEAAELAVKITNSQSQIIVTDKNPDFPSRGALNSNRAREDFQFSPTVELETGLTKYYEWLKNNPIFRNTTSV